MLCLSKTDFRAVIINMFKELKQTILKELKKNLKTVTLQADNLDKETETIHINHTEFLDLKSMITGGVCGRRGPHLRGTTAHLRWQKKKTSEPENKSIERIQSKVQKEKMIKEK